MKTKKIGEYIFNRSFKEEKYKKVVTWEKDDFSFFQSWIMIIFIALLYPIFYIDEKRKVTYIKIKGE